MSSLFSKTFKVFTVRREELRVVPHALVSVEFQDYSLNFFVRNFLFQRQSDSRATRIWVRTKWIIHSEFSFETEEQIRCIPLWLKLIHFNRLKHSLAWIKNPLDSLTLRFSLAILSGRIFTIASNKWIFIYLKEHLLAQTSRNLENTWHSCNFSGVCVGLEYWREYGERSKTLALLYRNSSPKVHCNPSFSSFKKRILSNEKERGPACVEYRADFD